MPLSGFRIRAAVVTLLWLQATLSADEVGDVFIRSFCSKWSELCGVFELILLPHTPFVMIGQYAQHMLTSVGGNVSCEGVRIQDHC
jgi:hypothetical protein